MARKSRKNLNQTTVAESNHQAVPDAANIFSAAAYGRLSVENGGNETDETLHTQMEILYRYIEEQPDLKLADSYMDNGYTGTNFDRPEFMRLMEDVRTGKINCIVIKDLSRFGRNYLETGYYLETVLPYLNVRLIAVNDNYDSFRKADQESLAVPIKNMVNALYAKDLSKKICVASEARRKRTDVVPFGNAPYGYDINEERTRYVVDPEAAEYIRAVFQWKRMGLTSDAIAKRMNLMGVPVATDYRDIKEIGTSSNKKWSYCTVNTIINNQAYAGDTVMGKLRKSLYRGEESRRVPRDEWTVIEDTHMPLVSRADLAVIQSNNKYRKIYANRYKPYNIKAREAMNDQMVGLVFCKECGCRMNYVRYRNDYSVATPEEIEKELRDKKNGIGRTEYYWCPPDAGRAKCGGHRVSADLLKIIVMDQLNFQICNMTDTSKLIEKARSSNSGKDPVLSTKRKLTAAKAKVADAENQIIRLYEDFADGTLDIEDYKLLKEDRLQRKKQLMKECEELEQTISRQQSAIERLCRTAKELSSADIGNGFNEDLVRRTVEKIIVSADGNIEIRFVFQDVVSEIVIMMKEAGE